MNVKILEPDMQRRAKDLLVEIFAAEYREQLTDYYHYGKLDELRAHVVAVAKSSHRSLRHSSPIVQGVYTILMYPIEQEGAWIVDPADPEAIMELCQKLIDGQGWDNVPASDLPAWLEAAE